MAAESAPGTACTYLVYTDDGMQLAYSGDDAAVFEEVCQRLSAVTTGHVQGYQFVGRQRVDVWAFFDAVPSDSFLAARARRDLFDFGWHDHGVVNGEDRWPG